MVAERPSFTGARWVLTEVAASRVAELQSAINASKQMYSAACTRLGVNNDLDDEEGGEA